MYIYCIYLYIQVYIYAVYVFIWYIFNATCMKSCVSQIIIQSSSSVLVTGRVKC